MEDLIQEFISQRVWAVVGVSLSPEKHGNKIFRDLRSAGYIVYAINPGGGKLDGQKLYPSLADLPERPAVVDIVVPPKITADIVRQCAELRLTRVWMQPGSESAEAIRFCQEQGIQVVHSACAMIQKREW
jgi:hypothetical protein